MLFDYSSQSPILFDSTNMCDIFIMAGEPIRKSFLFLPMSWEIKQLQAKKHHIIVISNTTRRQKESSKHNSEYKEKFCERALTKGILNCRKVSTI